MLYILIILAVEKNIGISFTEEQAKLSVFEITVGNIQRCVKGTLLAAKYLRV